MGEARPWRSDLLYSSSPLQTLRVQFSISIHWVLSSARHCTSYQEGINGESPWEGSWIYKIKTTLWIRKQNVFLDPEWQREEEDKFTLQIAVASFKPQGLCYWKTQEFSQGWEYYIRRKMKGFVVPFKLQIKKKKAYLGSKSFIFCMVWVLFIICLFFTCITGCLTGFRLTKSYKGDICTWNDLSVKFGDFLFTVKDNVN